MRSRGQAEGAEHGEEIRFHAGSWGQDANAPLSHAVRRRNPAAAPAFSPGWPPQARGRCFECSCLRFSRATRVEILVVAGMLNTNSHNRPHRTALQCYKYT